MAKRRRWLAAPRLPPSVLDLDDRPPLPSRDRGPQHLDVQSVQVHDRHVRTDETHVRSRTHAQKNPRGFYEIRSGVAGYRVDTLPGAAQNIAHVTVWRQLTE